MGASHATPPSGDERTAVPDSDVTRRAGGTDSSHEKTVRVPAPLDPRAREGRPFGRYRLLAEVGRGGMGVVYEAYDRELDRVVALKQVAGNPSRDQVERFLREARLAAKLSHPSIVQVHDVGEHEGVPYYTSEFIEGVSLERAMRESVPPARRVAWVEETALALAYAHQHGVVHRDVKPGNILVDAEGKARVTDFGLAKETSLAGDTSTLTASGDLIGTPAYMSPEQAEGHVSEIGPASDQFSLGVVLYQLLTGVRPFESVTLRNLLDVIVTSDPVPPTRVDRQVHRDLEAICLKTLEKDPRHRYASMQEFARDLRRFLDGEPIEARSVSFVGRMMRRASRHRAVTVTAVCTLLVVAACWTWFLVDRLAQSRREARLAEESRVRGEAEKEAMEILEDARPCLDDATRYLYERDARYEELTKRVEGAEKLIQDAIGKAPQLAIAHHLLGKARLLLGYEEDAEEEWKKAVACDPRFAPSRLDLARLQLEQAFITKQIAHYLASGRLEEETRRLADSAKREIDEVLRLPHRGDLAEDELALAGAMAMQAYVSGQLLQVAEMVNRDLERFGDKRGAEQFHLMRGLADPHENEMDCYDRALAIRPRFPLALFVRGVCHFEKGELLAALHDYDEAIAIRPRFLAVLSNRGSLRGIRNDLDGALADLNKAIEVSPHYVLARRNRSIVHAHRNEYEAALADATDAVEFDPGDAMLHLGRAQLFATMGRWKEAIPDLDAALATDPRSLDGLRLRAAARVQMKDYAAALKDLDAVLDLAPRETESWRTRGRLRQMMGDSKGYLEDAKSAVAVAPGRADCWIEQAMAREANGDKPGAIADYEKTIEVFASTPGDKDARVGRDAHLFAAGLCMPGNPEKALAHLEEAVAKWNTERREIERDPRFTPLHSDPRWAEILRRAR